tara:strand:- start:1622 stop:2188 length:567 start_codon:yes stop_codon:yes gene_type:complete
MAKKFDIHDWQASQRQKLLNEVNIKRVVDQSMSNDDIGKLQDVVRSNDLGKVLNTLAVIVDQDGSQPELAAQKIADLVPEIIDVDAAIQKYYYGKDDKEQPVSSKFSEPIGEHHGDENFPKQSAEMEKFLTKLKRANPKVYDQVEDIIRNNFKKQNEASMTGTGTSFNAGSGEGYMTPNAFKKKRKKD